jgi:DNA mismatch endonuclease (patch repair protein)
VVFKKIPLALFVHGCFWHGHACKRGARIPKENRSYWVAKILRNAARDKSVRRKLVRRGWKTATIWECQTKDAESLRLKILSLLRRVAINLNYHGGSRHFRRGK